MFLEASLRILVFALQKSSRIMWLVLSKKKHSYIYLGQLSKIFGKTVQTSMTASKKPPVYDDVDVAAPIVTEIRTGSKEQQQC